MGRKPVRTTSARYLSEESEREKGRERERERERERGSIKERCPVF